MDNTKPTTRPAMVSCWSVLLSALPPPVPSTERPYGIRALARFTARGARYWSRSGASSLAAAVRQRVPQLWPTGSKHSLPSSRFKVRAAGGSVASRTGLDMAKPSEEPASFCSSARHRAQKPVRERLRDDVPHARGARLFRSWIHAGHRRGLVLSPPDTCVRPLTQATVPAYDRRAGLFDAPRTPQSDHSNQRRESPTVEMAFRDDHPLRLLAASSPRVDLVHRRRVARVLSGPGVIHASKRMSSHCAAFTGSMKDAPPCDTPTSSVISDQARGGLSNGFSLCWWGSCPHPHGPPQAMFSAGLRLPPKPRNSSLHAFLRMPTTGLASLASAAIIVIVCHHKSGCRSRVERFPREGSVRMLSQHFV